jgi:hypothetical protein
MKTNTAAADTTSHAFLTGAILIANLDYSALGAYAIKMAIGGAIWMVFKLTGDYLAHKLLNKNRKKEKDEEEHSEQKED